MQATLEECKIEQHTSKTGKPYSFVIIKVAGQSYIGFGGKMTANWKAGDTVNLELFEEEYNGKLYKKFRPLSKVDMLESRIKVLEERIQHMAKWAQNFEIKQIPGQPPKEDLPWENEEELPFND